MVICKKVECLFTNKNQNMQIDFLLTLSSYKYLVRSTQKFVKLKMVGSGYDDNVIY
jgi:hypothetical protein